MGIVKGPKHLGCIPKSQTVKSLSCTARVESSKIKLLLYAIIYKTIDIIYDHSTTCGGTSVPETMRTCCKYDLFYTIPGMASLMHGAMCDF